MSGRLFQSGGRYCGALQGNFRQPVQPFTPLSSNLLRSGNEIVPHGPYRTMYFPQLTHITQPQSHHSGFYIPSIQTASQVECSSYNVDEDGSPSQTPRRALMSSTPLELCKTTETPGQQGQGDPEPQQFVNLTNEDITNSNSSECQSSVSNTSSFGADDWVQDQQSFFNLLEEICNEGARRKWESEIEQQLFRSLNPRRTISKSERSSRFEPYQRRRYKPESQAGWRFMDYISKIANAKWEKARASEVDRHRAESRAVEDMSCLYALATGVMVACEDGWRGLVFEPEKLRDISMGARALCRYLGYEEGKAKCDELMGEWADGEISDEGSNE